MGALGIMETITSAAQSALAFLAHYQQQGPFDLDDDRFVGLHERFIGQLPTIESLDHVNDAERASYREFCSRCHKRYLAIKEALANEKLRAVASSGGARTTGESLSGRDRQSYDRVRDLKKLVDFPSCKTVVMVGSGAFPSTLLWLRDNYPTLRYVGLDIDSRCVKMATELVAALGFDNVHFKLIDGRAYDFCSVDFVYVANHVMPKRAVLEQIARSTSVRQIVVREPTTVGELLAEAVRPNLPECFVADATGAASGRFNLSYDLLLRRV